MAATPPTRERAVLDSAHVGDIQGAFGTIRQHDTGARRSWRARALALLAIVGLTSCTSRDSPAGCAGEGASWIGGGGVRSSRGEGATTLGPGVWFGAGGGKTYSMVGLGWGAGSVACASTRLSAAAASIELSARPPAPPGLQATARTSGIPSNHQARSNMSAFPC